MVSSHILIIMGVFICILQMCGYVNADTSVPRYVCRGHREPQLLLLSLYRVSCSLSGVCARLASLGASRDPFKSTPSHISSAGTADD